MAQQEDQQPNTQTAHLTSDCVGGDLPPAPAKTSDFHAGERVLYVPMHAHGDPKHADCERGVVSSINQSYAFVVYQGRFQGQATRPDDLVKLPSAAEASA